MARAASGMPRAGKKKKGSELQQGLLAVLKAKDVNTVLLALGGLSTELGTTLHEAGIPGHAALCSRVNLPLHMSRACAAAHTRSSLLTLQ